MVTYADIIKEVNLILKKEYPDIKRYGNDTVDNAVPPYFFVEVVPLGVSRESKNMLKKSCSVKITFVQKTIKQVEALNVSGRKLLVSDYSHEYIEDHGNIPQISFSLEWYESTEYHDGDLITDISLTIEKKGR